MPQVFEQILFLFYSIFLSHTSSANDAAPPPAAPSPIPVLNPVAPPPAPAAAGPSPGPPRVLRREYRTLPAGRPARPAAADEDLTAAALNSNKNRLCSKSLWRRLAGFWSFDKVRKFKSWSSFARWAKNLFNFIIIEEKIKDYEKNDQM